MAKAKSKKIITDLTKIVKLSTPRPAKLPRWATVPYVDPIVGGSNVVEPPEQQKDDGWLRKQKPPANFQNWLHNVTYLWLEYLDQGVINVGTTTGTQPNYNISIPGIDAYFEFLIIYVKFHATNTVVGATLNINSIGAVNIKRSDGSNIDTGDLNQNAIYVLIFDGTEFRISAMQRATQSSRGIIKIATAAETKAATDDTSCIAPSNAKYHPGMAKAWVNFDGVGAAIQKSYNVTSVTKNGTGNYTINFTNNMSDTNFCVSANAELAVPPGVAVTTQIYSSSVSSVRITVINSATGVFIDPARAYVIVHGELA